MERARGRKCIQRDDVVACFGCSHPLVDGSLQLFGRAPMAAFNGDAAQNRKRKKRDSVCVEGVLGVCLSLHYRKVFLAVLFS